MSVFYLWAQDCLGLDPSLDLGIAAAGVPVRLAKYLLPHSGSHCAPRKVSGTCRSASRPPPPAFIYPPLPFFLHARFFFSLPSTLLPAAPFHPSPGFPCQCRAIALRSAETGLGFDPELLASFYSESLRSRALPYPSSSIEFAFPRTERLTDVLCSLCVLNHPLSPNLLSTPHHHYGYPATPTRERHR